MSEIDDVIKRIERAVDTVQRFDAKKTDLVKEQIFIAGGPFLHQNSDGMSEKESADFERSNQELFDFLRSLDDQLRDMF